MKTVLLAVIGGLFLSGPLQASPDLVRIFAGCAGRFSAETEHAWLLGDSRADHFEERLEIFVTLLDAVVAEGDRRALLNFRVDAKLAHAALLTSTTFSEKGERAARARSLANGYLTACDRLLLDSSG